IVTGGGVVPGDHGRRVEGERAQLVDAAADPHTVAPPHSRGATIGLVELDRAAEERDGRRAEGGGAVDEQTPAQAVATVAPRRPCAADGLVAQQVRVREDGCHPEGGEQTPAQALASVAALGHTGAGRAADPAAALL